MTKEDAAKYISFLDRLRESGRTNMFGAAPFLADEFGMNIADARKILLAWMDTFGDDDRETTMLELLKENSP